MRLSDVMSGAGLTGYAEIGLVVSFVAFLLVVAWTLVRLRAAIDAQSRAPLDEGDGAATGHAPRSKGGIES